MPRHDLVHPCTSTSTHKKSNLKIKKDNLKHEWRERKMFTNVSQLSEEQGSGPQRWVIIKDEFQRN